MNNRPHLAIFALCVAGIVGLGPALVFAAFGQPIPGWWLSGLGVFVFLGVTAVGINQDWAIRDSEDKARTEALKVTTAERLARLAAAEAVSVPAPQPEPDYTPDWQVAVRRFAQAGEWHGFDVRVLAADDSPAKVTTYDGWTALRRVMKAGGWLRGENYTRWAMRKSYAAWNAERGWEGLTYPPTPAPEVEIPVQGGLQRHTTTPPVVIEGVVSGERA